jgi:hypothetical protein
LGRVSVGRAEWSLGSGDWGFLLGNGGRWCGREWPFFLSTGDAREDWFCGGSLVNWLDDLVRGAIGPVRLARFGGSSSAVISRPGKGVDVRVSWCGHRGLGPSASLSWCYDGRGNGGEITSVLQFGKDLSNSIWEISIAGAPQNYTRRGRWSIWSVTTRTHVYVTPTSWKSYIAFRRCSGGTIPT